MLEEDGKMETTGSNRDTLGAYICTCIRKEIPSRREHLHFSSHAGTVPERDHNRRGLELARYTIPDTIRPDRCIRIPKPGDQSVNHGSSNGLISPQAETRGTVELSGI
ncbi:hypothetical protein AWENTII_001509 [Aspergillus wentii]